MLSAVMQMSLDFGLLASTILGEDLIASEQGNGSIYLKGYSFKVFCIRLIF